MTIIYKNFGVTGQVGVHPRRVQLIVTDSLATLTTANYLQPESLLPSVVYATDIFDCIYNYNKTTKSGSYVELLPTITAGVITLNVAEGNVTLPTIANHIATYTNTTGGLSEDPATAISGGNIQAGLSGTAGYLASFPATLSKGSLHVAAVANTGDTITTVSNVAMGQASIVSIPDPANASGRFLVGATATPFVSGNFPKNSGTGGLMVDSGLAVSNIATTSTAVLLTPAGDQSITAHNLTVAQGNLQAGSSGHAGTVGSFPSSSSNGELILAAVNAGGAFNTTISNGTMGQSSVITIPDPAGATGNFVVAPAALVTNNAVKASGTAGLVVDGGYAFHAGTTGSYAGGGTSNAFTVTGMASSWIVTASILTQSNTASIVKAVPSSNTLTITFSADPGAATTVSWIASTASV